MCGNEWLGHALFVCKVSWERPRATALHSSWKFGLTNSANDFFTPRKKGERGERAIRQECFPASELFLSRSLLDHGSYINKCGLEFLSFWARSNWLISCVHIPHTGGYSLRWAMALVWALAHRGDGLIDRLGKIGLWWFYYAIIIPGTIVPSFLLYVRLRAEHCSNDFLWLNSFTRPELLGCRWRSKEKTIKVWLFGKGGCFHPIAKFLSKAFAESIRHSYFFGVFTKVMSLKNGSLPRPLVRPLVF